ncbi:hypothetical protein [Burkholderia arboris]|uniref:hypothetical protein n=1 Tax=Burkholderia arboris TaxID=488730 RepID=UPI001CF3D872|nr:hypothetical protein [Burkholderia arboris]MCA8045525.1 hypothetical protein [Burkholderia arboris]
MNKERPILFSGPMVRAILEGRKTQTRRIAIPKRSCVDFIGGGPKDGPDWNDPTCWGFEDPNTGFWWALRGNDECYQLPCPHGMVGDRLWVRETWAQPAALDPGPTVYRADYPACVPKEFENVPDAAAIRWKPSIHMPRAMSRITLEIAGVRVERLQAISEADAAAEGVESPETERDNHDWSICPRCGGTRLYDAIGPNLGVMPDTDCFECDTHIKRFRYLWDSIHSAAGHGWDANPFLWVVEFKHIEA